MAQSGQGRGRQSRHRLEFSGLFLLTVVTGVVDAAAFLGLGSVFVANMTGNVLLLGFSVAGSPATHAAGLSTGLTAVALGGFAAGAGAGALTVGRRDRAPRLLLSFGAEAAMLGAALTVVALGGPTATGARYSAVVLLALAMGVQNATVRRMGRADVNTTVLTTALGGLVSDAVDVGGVPARAGRRFATVLFLFFGAAAGAALERWGVVWAVTAALVTFVPATAAVVGGAARSSA